MISNDKSRLKNEKYIKELRFLVIQASGMLGYKATIIAKLAMKHIDFDEYNFSVQSIVRKFVYWINENGNLTQPVLVEAAENFLKEEAPQLYEQLFYEEKFISIGDRLSLFFNGENTSADLQVSIKSYLHKYAGVYEVRRANPMTVMSPPYIHSGSSHYYFLIYDSKLNYLIAHSIYMDESPNNIEKISGEISSRWSGFGFVRNNEVVLLLRSSLDKDGVIIRTLTPYQNPRSDGTFVLREVGIMSSEFSSFETGGDNIVNKTNPIDMRLSKYRIEEFDEKFIEIFKWRL